jgi:hypothetical protein
MAEWSRWLFHQYTQERVANSTSSTVRQGPCMVISSALYKPMTLSARAFTQVVNYTARRWWGQDCPRHSPVPPAVRKAVRVRRCPPDLG